MTSVAFAMGRFGRAEEPVEFDFVPEPQTVSGEVEARFIMTEPDIS